MNQSNTRSKTTLFAHNKGMLILSIVGKCFKVIAGLGFTGFIQRILDTIAGKAQYSVLSLMVYALFCILSLAVAAVLEYYCWTEFRGRALEQYREHAYKHILSKHAYACNQESMDTYISSLSNDLLQVFDNYIEMIPYSVEILLSFVGTVVLMIYYNVRLAIVAFIFSMLPLIFSFFRMKEVEKREEELSEANSFF